MAGLTRNSLAFLLAATATGGVIGAWSSRSQAPGGRADAAVASFAGSPDARPAASRGASVVGPARLEPVSGEIDLAADVVGVLAAIAVKEGDHVKRGQILADFASRDAAARVDQATATLQIQTARLDKLKKGPRTQERQQAVASIQEQDATLARVQRDLDRQKTLYARGYASNAQLELAQSAQAVATAKKKNSAEALAMMDAGPRSEDLADAQAQVKLAKAQLDEAQAALERTRIRAPIDGVILRVYKHPGEVVGIGSVAAVLQIGDLDRIVARTQIDEADIGRVAKGDRAYVTAPAFPGKQFGGEVTDVSPRLGAKTIQTGAPTEKRDASVLDVLVTLDPGTVLPIGLRVDCYVLDHRNPS